MLFNDEYYMNEALKEAKIAYSLGEIPVGAIIVDNLTHEIIARAHNEKELKRDATCHAEIIAIKKASRVKKNWRLNDTTLYVTLEPCIMCGSAILQSRIDRLVFSVHEFNTGSFGGKIDLSTIEKTSITVTNGILKEESVELLSSFFKIKRSNY